MIRAILLAMLGCEFEVRLISTKSGKDIPGRRLLRGSYWKCRKLFKSKDGKYGEAMRLQAITTLDWKMNGSVMTIIDEASEVPPDAWEKPLPVAEPDFMEVRVEGEFPADPELVPVHECDENGPMEWGFNVDHYVPTCSQCGELMEDEDATV